MSDCKHPRGNVVITEDYHVISRGRVRLIPGCVCAYQYQDGQMFAVVHEDGRTKILRIQKDKQSLLLERDGLIDIINISIYWLRDESIYVFSTPEGIRFSFDESGNRVKRPRRILKDTVGVVGKYVVRYDGKVTSIHGDSDVIDRVKGYNLVDEIGWTDHQIFDMRRRRNPNKIIKFTYHRIIDDVYISSDYNARNFDLIMILSEGIIHSKVIDHGNMKESRKLRGTWKSVPIYLYHDVYIIDHHGILRDIRSAMNDDDIKFYDRFMDIYELAKSSQDMLYSTEPSLYEQGIIDEDDIGILHGMRVFNPPTMVKSSRKR